MTQDEILRDRLWGVFRLLEMANVEAMKTKRQVALIANTDPRRGGDVDLVPGRFHIDGHHYGALVTTEQQDQILATIGKGTAEDVLNLIALNFLEGHLYVAVELVTTILIGALKNQDLTAQLTAQLKALTLPGPNAPTVGACKYPNGTCQQPCGAPLCLTLGGTPSTSCQSERGPDDNDGKGDDDES
jgi:hypothetical protein